MTSWDVSSFSQAKRPFSEVAPSCKPKNGTFPHYSLSGSLKFNSPPLFSFSSQRKEKIRGSSSIIAHSSTVIPFQYLGTWERGREIVVYLGWEMAGLGNRTLCHSLCHSLCDPDLFPAFLTPPLSWGKWCLSCNPHCILPNSWDTVLKKMGIGFGRLALYSAQLNLNLPFWGCPPLLFLKNPCFLLRWWTCHLFYIIYNSLPSCLSSMSSAAASLPF